MVVKITFYFKTVSSHCRIFGRPNFVFTAQFCAVLIIDYKTEKSFLQC